jgi:putative transposase
MTPTSSSNEREGEAPAELSFDFLLRRHPTHGVFADPTNPPIVFVTVCTKNRVPWLATPAVHRRLVEIWQQARAWLVGRYILMPDHIHLFAAPGDREIPFDNWVRYWKSQYTKRSASPHLRWQPDHWDRRLRTEESYDLAWEYVCRNPVRKGLVASTEDWPYQGELFELRWA